VSWLALVFVAAGGALGAALRAAALRWNRPGRVPYATLAVNVTGSFALGWLAGGDLPVSPAVLAGLTAGVLGGYTTYSTFAVETALLAQAGRRAAVYAAVTIAASIAAAGAGVWIAR